MSTTTRSKLFHRALLSALLVAGLALLAAACSDAPSPTEPNAPSANQNGSANNVAGGVPAGPDIDVEKSTKR